MPRTYTELMIRYWEASGRERKAAPLGWWIGPLSPAGSIMDNIRYSLWWNSVAACYLHLAYRALRRETAAQIHKLQLSSLYGTMKPFNPRSIK